MRPRIDIASTKLELNEINASSFQEFMCTLKDLHLLQEVDSLEPFHSAEFISVKTETSFD